MALGQSKYERVQQITSDKRKELKESQEKAAQIEKNKQQMDEIREELSEQQRNLESLENSDAPQRDIDKSKARIRTLEAEHVKARNKYEKSVGVKENAESIQEVVSVLEDLEEEDTVAEERDGAREALIAIQRRKEILGTRKEYELRTLVRETDPEKIRAAKDKLFDLDKSYRQIVADENTFKTILGEKLTITEEKKEQLKKEREILEKNNEEDKKIVNNRDKWPDERRRANQRIDFRNQEIRQINAQLEEGGEPLIEKVKAIFKKYGLTLTGIFVAAGVVIGTIVGVITDALKTMGKKFANGLKALGQKAASALPGLIGSIVSFLFKTAGQVVGFLAEHTWLLILAVVAFLVEKVIKKQS